MIGFDGFDVIRQEKQSIEKGLTNHNCAIHVCIQKWEANKLKKCLTVNCIWNESDAVLCLLEFELASKIISAYK